MKIVTANRLSDGKVIYADADGRAVESFEQAGLFDDEAAAAPVLQRAVGAPAVFVNPYLVDVGAAGPSGRDRLKETIRATGPTVGHSVGVV